MKALLMSGREGLPRAKGSNLVRTLLQGVKQGIHLGAGKAEYGVDAIDDQSIDDGHAAGHRRSYWTVDTVASDTTFGGRLAHAYLFVMALDSRCRGN